MALNSILTMESSNILIKVFTHITENYGENVTEYD